VKITGFDIFTFSLPAALESNRQAGLPVVQPFSLKGNSLSKRDGFLIRLNSSDGAVGFGEISPLPGFSQESLVEVKLQLKSLRLKIFNETIPQNCEKLEGVLGFWLSKYRLFPSVQFGFETAVLNLLADQKKVTLQRFLSPSKKINRKSIPLVGLLEGSLENIAAEAKRMRKQGFRSFKLKVGAKNIAQDIEKVRRVQGVLKGQGTLRLDANQFWEFLDALCFAKAIEKDSIEYIEEPFKNISTQLSRITEFFKASGIPVALDESLAGMNPEDFKSYHGLRAVILKPTILGGIEKTFHWIQKARAKGIDIVISSTFESGMGLLTLARLAAAFACHPSGLDTYKWFSKDVLTAVLAMDQGNLILPSMPLNEHQLNFSLLKKI